MRSLFFCLAALAMTAAGLAQTTRPTTQPATEPSDSQNARAADQALAELLKPTTNPSRPLPPSTSRATTDTATESGAVKPTAPPVSLKREGTYIMDRAGRLSHDAKGQPEFTFDSDGTALRDPPLSILPNSRLMQMEDQVKGTDRDLHYRVTGMITEYRGRNYILLEKISIVPDVVQQF